MSNINLLPWREAQRARNDKKLLTTSLIFWAVCGAVGLLALNNINNKLDMHQKRNEYLVAKNAVLDRKIAEVKELQARKQELLERIELIQNLQRDRVRIVHVFDDIVQKLPAGVTLDNMKKQAKAIHLIGRAQSNSRVSELMNQANTSKFFGSSNLKVVALKGARDSDLREFNVVLTEADKEVANAGSPTAANSGAQQ